MLLLAASHIFYLFAGLQFSIYVIAVTIAAFMAGRGIHSLQKKQSEYLRENKSVLDSAGKKQYRSLMKGRQKKWLTAGLIATIGLLAVVKYTNFVIDNINSILGLAGSGSSLSFINILLPLGMSFYTFQAVGYIIDVYRGKHPAENNIFKFSLFVSFFPQMIQGPISRFEDLSTTLYGGHEFNVSQFSFGLQRILWGYFKKMVIADRILAAVNIIFQDAAQYRGTYVMIGMIFYAIQLYADFTGGIDITIGIAQALGIKLRENFERPFFSKSVAEYWRRWHISMGTWFRDYIFYPLSVSKNMIKLSNYSRSRLGEKTGRKIPVYTATIVVWFITGLWHGASWNFVVWGLLNGLIIIVSQEFSPLYKWFHRHFKVENKLAFRAFQVVRTFWLMSSVRMLDCYRDVGLTFRQYGTIFSEFRLSTFTDGSLLKLGLSSADYAVLAFGIAAMLSVSLLQRKGGIRIKLADKPLALRYALFTSIIMAILIFGAYGIGFEANQFIYNQF
jgi:D-alanyl-lipoteichoic acid acyltransferase DltB (MBOAT superfamily)